MTQETAEAPRQPLPFTSPEVGQLALALAKAQAAFAPIVHSRTVTVTMKSGGKYTFSYAELPAILDAIRPALAANGLAVTQLLRGSAAGQVLVTMLLHESGQWLRSDLPVVATEPGNQALGSSISYMRRYAVAALLCIAADEDDDGNAGEGNQIANSQRKGEQPPAQPLPKPVFAGEPQLITFQESVRGQFRAAATATALEEAWVKVKPDLLALKVSPEPLEANAAKSLRQDYLDRLAELKAKPAPTQTVSDILGADSIPF